MNADDLAALWLVQPVRCVGLDDDPCGWSGVGADITEYEDNGETPICPGCDEGVVENVNDTATAAGTENAK